MGECGSELSDKSGGGKSSEHVSSARVDLLIASCRSNVGDAAIEAEDTG